MKPGWHSCHCEGWRIIPDGEDVTAAASLNRRLTRTLGRLAAFPGFYRPGRRASESTVEEL